MKYDVSGIGSPLLDLSLEVDDHILNSLNLKKGSMKLLSLDEARQILSLIESKGFDIRKSPGGQTANVLAGVSVLGGKSVFLGKIGDDEHGKIYYEASKRIGTHCRLSKHEELDTGYAITFITPDGERTFATYLGASPHFGINDLDEKAIKLSKILHIEGFSLEDERFRKTIIHAVELAHHNNVKISLDLSDGELIKRNFNYFHYFVEKYVDVIFANENEAEAFTGERGLKALEKMYKKSALAIVKLGERGSLIRDAQNIYEILAHETDFLNSNGAGDIYAAGILYGLSKDIPLEKAGNLASYIASLVVAKNEARIEEDLSHLIK